MMFGPDRTAGASAIRRFDTLVRAWRRRVIRPFLLGTVVLVIGFSVANAFVAGQAKFWLGMLAGATVTLYLALRDSPPFHIEKWRLGGVGERRTANALRPLRGEGWFICHDRTRDNRTNVDHIVVGNAGVFLLDSKNFSGEAYIEGRELKVRWLEDPEEGWTCYGIVSRMRAASADLKEKIEPETGVRWVQPVVVLWTRFPARVAKVSDVAFVHGDALADWLRARKPSAQLIDLERICR